MARIVEQLISDPPVMHRQFRYGFRSYRLQLAAALGSAGAALCALAVAGFAEGHPGWIIIAVLCLVGLVSSGRRIVDEVVYDIDVVGGGRLVWRTWKHSGVVYVDDLLLVHPYPRRASLALIELADGSELAIVVRKGFAPFTTALADVRPGMPISLPNRARSAERLPLPSGFHPRTWRPLPRSYRR